MRNIKYITHNGEVIQGDSPFRVLSELKAGSKFCAEESMEEFMTGFAFRWQEYSGHKIKFKIIEEFLDQLIQTGYMKEF